MSSSIESRPLLPSSGGRLRPVRFGSARVGLVSLAAGEVARPPNFVEGELHLLFVRSGVVDLVDLARPSSEGLARLRHGESVLLVGERLPDLAAARATAPAELLMIAVPVDAAEGVELGKVHGRLVPRTSELIRPVVAFVERALHQPRPWQDVPGITAYYFERLLNEMVSGVLVETVLARDAPRPLGAFDGAMSVIMVRRSDPGLTPAIVAAEANVSLRQLERLFRERGTTPARTIRRARVELARTLLADPTYGVLNVDDIARRVGFANGSSLARAMSAESLPSPTQVRRGIPRPIGPSSAT